MPGNWRRTAACIRSAWVLFAEKLRLALKLLDEAKHVPHDWITTDDDFGRAIAEQVVPTSGEAPRPSARNTKPRADLGAARPDLRTSPGVDTHLCFMDNSSGRIAALWPATLGQHV